MSRRGKRDARTFTRFDSAALLFFAQFDILRDKTVGRQAALPALFKKAAAPRRGRTPRGVPRGALPLKISYADWARRFLLSNRG